MSAMCLLKCFHLLHQFLTQLASLLGSWARLTVALITHVHTQMLYVRKIYKFFVDVLLQCASRMSCLIVTTLEYLLEESGAVVTWLSGTTRAVRVPPWVRAATHLQTWLTAGKAHYWDLLPTYLQYQGQSHLIRWTHWLCIKGMYLIHTSAIFEQHFTKNTFHRTLLVTIFGYKVSSLIFSDKCFSYQVIVNLFQV